MGDNLRTKFLLVNLSSSRKRGSIQEFVIMKFLLTLLVLFVVSTSAHAAAPRTLGRPLLHNKEMSMVKVGGVCDHTRGCYEIVNQTGWAQVVGNTGPGAAPGQALIVDSPLSGIPTGAYLGTETVVGQYRDEILGEMDMIDGQFVSVLFPGQSAFVTVDKGVTEVRTWSFTFEPELNTAPINAYDVRLKRVVQYYAGVLDRLQGRNCHVTNDPFVETASPGLAWIRTGDCKYSY